MATSGSFTTSGYDAANAPDHYVFSWELSSQSVSGNYSIITWSLTAGGGKNEYWWTNVQEKYVTVDGATQENSIAQETYNGTTPFSGTTTIYHNADGTKTFEASAGGAFYYFGMYNSTGSGSWSLPTIPRASSLTSVGDVMLGDRCNVQWTPASSQFKYKLKFLLGGWSATTDFISPKQASAYTYTGYTIPTNELLSLIPNSTTANMTATLYTYDASGAQIGTTSSKTFTATVPATVVPTVGTIKLEPQSYKYLLQNKNTLKISVSESSAGAGSGIKSYTFSGPGVSKTTSNTSVTSSKISSTGTLVYTVKVTDTRGRTASKTAEVICYEYIAPTITLNAYRVGSSSSTKEDKNGTYVRCEYNCAFSSVDGKNKISIKIHYKKSGESSWGTSVDVTTGSTNTSGSYTLNNIDANSTYVVYATITDQYDGETSSTHSTIFGTSRILNITSDGTGVAIGKMAESPNSFDVRWDSHFGGDVNIDCNITAANILQAVPLWSGQDSGTIAIDLPDGDDLDSYTYLEVYYADNNGKGHGYTKVCQPNGKELHLSLIEASQNTVYAGRTYIRRTSYGITGNGTKVTITPHSAGQGYIMIKASNESGDPLSFYLDANYISITKVVGYK